MNAVDALLLRRERVVFVAASAPMRAEPGVRVDDIDTLETRLAKLGFRPDDDLIQRLSGFTASRLAEFGLWLQAALEAETGADRAHAPLLDDFTTTPRRSASSDEAEPEPLTLLRLGGDRDSAAREMLTRLLTRQSPLSKADGADLQTLLGAFPRVLDIIPERIPVKETMAVVFGSLLRAGDPDAVLAAAAPHLRTATDVLRVVCVWMGGPADLLSSPKPMPSLPRRQRRSILAALERLDAETLVEDCVRHAGLWKLIGERLHPLESAAALPKSALAFAVLRKTKIDPSTALGRTLLEAASLTRRIVLVGDSLRFRGRANDIESALRARDGASALEFLRGRPGELFRRLDHLARLMAASQPGSLASLDAAVRDTVAKVSAPILVAILPHLRNRTEPLSRRVFFPKGVVAHSFTVPDTRPMLSEEATAPIVSCLEGEFLRRAGARPVMAGAVLDADLADLMVPANERSVEKSLVVVPRGSHLPIPAGKLMRLFVHWVQPEDTRVDLDLSVALYDNDWGHVGTCDFGNLRFANGVIQHSGDFTSAPAPKGASEFIDVVLKRVRAAKVRHLVPIVFSFNSVPFDRMPEAFAGMMLRDSNAGEVFDPRAVAQRFDLTGSAKVAIPMLVDLLDRRMRWVDIKIPPTGNFHSVGGYRRRIGQLGRDLSAYFGSGTRMTMWELACFHAAARTPVVQVRQPFGRVGVYRRGNDEPLIDFHRRLVGLEAPDRDADELDLSPRPHFVSVVRADLDLPAGSVVYAMDTRELRGTVRRLDAGDLVAELGR